eukprot:1025505-Amorphochlora_amoeboformis.AAC.2
MEEVGLLSRIIWRMKRVYSASGRGMLGIRGTMAGRLQRLLKTLPLHFCQHESDLCEGNLFLDGILYHSRDVVVRLFHGLDGGDTCVSWESLEVDVVAEHEHSPSTAEHVPHSLLNIGELLFVLTFATSDSGCCCHSTCGGTVLVSGFVCTSFELRLVVAVGVEVGVEIGIDQRDPISDGEDDPPDFDDFDVDGLDPSGDDPDGLDPDVLDSDDLDPDDLDPDDLDPDNPDPDNPEPDSLRVHPPLSSSAPLEDLDPRGRRACSELDSHSGNRTKGLLACGSLPRHGS